MIKIISKNKICWRVGFTIYLENKYICFGLDGSRWLTRKQHLICFSRVRLFFGDRKSISCQLKVNSLALKTSNIQLCIKIWQFYCLHSQWLLLCCFPCSPYCAHKIFESAANIRAELLAACLLHNRHMCQINKSVRCPLRTVDSTLSIR